MEDQQIWEEIKKGNKLALRELHDKYFHQVCLYAFRATSDSGLAEEMVSGCFIKIWENRDRIDIKVSVKHYLFLMARNSVVDCQRKRKILIEPLDKIPEPADEEVFDDQKKYANLYAVLEKLPAQRKNILELAVFQSLSYNDIAERLQISRNTVKTQISRAYRFLKENLDPEEFYFFFLTHR